MKSLLILKQLVSLALSNVCSILTSKEGIYGLGSFFYSLSLMFLLMALTDLVLKAINALLTSLDANDDKILEYIIDLC